ncbi:MAG: hypothetical protein Q9227_001569 [Pyrenula ochraceoflavens]
MGEYSFSPLDVHTIRSFDFAYEGEAKGPHFMAAQFSIADAPAKTFAEYVSFTEFLESHVCIDMLTMIFARAQASFGSSSRHLCFFYNELNGDGRKSSAKSGRIELVDSEPAAFELLVRWLYQGKIDDVSEKKMDQKWEYAEACQNLYLLCDKIQLQELKNIAIDLFRRACHEAGLVPGPEEMKPIYEKTPPSSPFRKLVSKIAARQIMDPESDKSAEAYRPCFESSPDFAIDVIVAIKKGSGGMLYADPTDEDACRDACMFHSHQNGDKCQRPN